MRRSRHTHTANVRTSAFTLVELLAVITDHQHVDGAVAAGGAVRPRGRPPGDLFEQPEAARHGHAERIELSRRSFPGFANWVGQNQTIRPALWCPSSLTLRNRTSTTCGPVHLRQHYLARPASPAPPPPTRWSIHI